MKPLISQRNWFLRKYLYLPEATGEPNARWEDYQFEYLNNDSLLGIDNKARQVGWSWTAAAEATAASCLDKRSTSIFVSINLEEAKEKIRYSKQIIESLDKRVRPKLVIDNQMELEFDNGSRLISHPCRPVRGKAKVNMYLDEFAHYPKDREIYTSALPATTRGGRLRIGSSPLGAGGMFWEIYDQKLRPYPGYRRTSIPWWLVSGLCKDVVEARKMAAAMTTEERVRLFGTSRLVEIFDNMPLEDFQQEYESAWVDESVAWISWEEIKKNQLDAQEGKHWYRSSTTVEGALSAIEETATACKEGAIESALAGGMDIGRKRNTTELGFVGKGTTPALPLRLSISLANVEFDDQRAVGQKAIEMLPVTKLLIDRNGLGMQLAEELEKTGKAEGVDFTNPNKELWSVELKVRMQRGQVPIPLDRDLSYQIHSIKKKITASKNAQFDTQANEKHHADKYWGLALAVWAAGQVGGSEAVVEGPEESEWERRRKSSWQ